MPEWWGADLPLRCETAIHLLSVENIVGLECALRKYRFGIDENPFVDPVDVLLSVRQRIRRLLPDVAGIPLAGWRLFCFQGQIYRFTVGFLHYMLNDKVVSGWVQPIQAKIRIRLNGIVSGEIVLG